jgi:hypothetical protein
VIVSQDVIVFWALSICPSRRQHHGRRVARSQGTRATLLEPRCRQVNRKTSIPCPPVNSGNDPALGEASIALRYNTMKKIVEAAKKHNKS